MTKRFENAEEARKTMPSDPFALREMPELIKKNCLGCVYSFVNARGRHGCGAPVDDEHVVLRACWDPDNEEGWVFIPDTPEGHAEYIAAKLEGEDD